MILEWLAFGSSLVSAWLYGKNGIKGPIAGLITCILFITFGFVAGLYAAIFANVIFLVVHGRNLKMSIDGDKQRKYKQFESFVEKLSAYCWEAEKTAGWNVDLDTGVEKPINVPEKLCLIHSEVSEALEAHRKGLNDDKLPHRSGMEVELVDVLIRTLALGGALGLDLAGAFAEKLEYNDVRPDHKLENRKKDGGKKY